MTDILEQRLIALAERLDVRVEDQLVADVLARLEHEPERLEGRSARRFVFAGVVCVVGAIVVALLVPGPRHTIAHWFGIGSTRIETSTTVATAAASTTTTTATTGAEPPGTTLATVILPGTSIASSATFPTSLDFGQATTASDAAARTGLPVPVVASLGPPAGIFVVSPPERGQIVVVYLPSATLPESPVGGVGALVSSMPGISTTACS